jgi:hypothetical protein
MQQWKEFKVNLPSTVMFNYPTIEGITGLGTTADVAREDV